MACKKAALCHIKEIHFPINSVSYHSNFIYTVFYICRKKVTSPIPTFLFEGLGVTNIAFTNISTQGAHRQLQYHRLCLFQHFSSRGSASILASPTSPLLTFKLKGLAVNFGVIEFAYANISARGAQCHQLFLRGHFGSWGSPSILASSSSPLPQIWIGDGVVAYIQAVPKILRSWSTT